MHAQIQSNSSRLLCLNTQFPWDLKTLNHVLLRRLKGPPLVSAAKHLNQHARQREDLNSLMIYSPKVTSETWKHWFPTAPVREFLCTENTCNMTGVFPIYLSSPCFLRSLLSVSQQICLLFMVNSKITDMKKRHIFMHKKNPQTHQGFYVEMPPSNICLS